MIFDPLYWLSKLRRLTKARYERAQYKGRLTLANATRSAAGFAFILLFFSFGAIGSDTFVGEAVAPAFPPRLIAGAAPPPAITAESAYIINPSSGFVLYDKNSTLALPPASTTKIVTALVARSHYGMDDVVKVPSDCAFREGESLMGLFPNEQIVVGNLLRGMLIASGSDAACALAGHFSGGELAFVEEMNAVAASLGIERMHFVNPSGVDADSHYATARGLTLLALGVRDDPALLEIVGTAEANISSVDGRRWHKLETTNELLRAVPGFLGIKTGYTAQAQEVLVFYFKQGQVELMGTVMGSDDRFGDTRALTNWVLASFIFP